MNVALFYTFVQIGVTSKFLFYYKSIIENYGFYMSSTSFRSVLCTIEWPFTSGSSLTCSSEAFQNKMRLLLSSSANMLCNFYSTSPKELFPRDPTLIWSPTSDVLLFLCFRTFRYGFTFTVGAQRLSSRVLNSLPLGFEALFAWFAARLRAPFRPTITEALLLPPSLLFFSVIERKCGVFADLSGEISLLRFA